MDSDMLLEALRLADAAAGVREAASELRQRFAGLRVVVVDAFDMRGERPAARGTRRDLFLGTSDGHCWQVTADPRLALGLFVCDRA